MVTDMVDLIEERLTARVGSGMFMRHAHAAKAIRAVLDIHKPDVQDGSVNADGKCCMCPGYGEPVSVHGRAYPDGDVLLMHGHMDVDNPVCAECGNAYEGEHVAYPCPTVLAVAAALGIEVTD